jgi:hypothetical protein
MPGRRRSKFAVNKQRSSTRSLNILLVQHLAYHFFLNRSCGTIGALIPNCGYHYRKLAAPAVGQLQNTKTHPLFEVRS